MPSPPLRRPSVNEATRPVYRALPLSKKALAIPFGWQVLQALALLDMLGAFYHHSLNRLPPLNSLQALFPEHHQSFVHRYDLSCEIQIFADSPPYLLQRALTLNFLLNFLILSFLCVIIRNLNLLLFYQLYDGQSRFLHEYLYPCMAQVYATA